MTSWTCRALLSSGSWGTVRSVLLLGLVTKYLVSGNRREKGFTLAHSLRVLSVRVGSHDGRMEAAGHMAPTVWKQRETDAGPQLLSSLYSVWDPTSLTVLPTLRVSLPTSLNLS